MKRQYGVQWYLASWYCRSLDNCHSSINSQPRLIQINWNNMLYKGEKRTRLNRYMIAHFEDLYDEKHQNNPTHNPKQVINKTFGWSTAQGCASLSYQQDLWVKYSTGLCIFFHMSAVKNTKTHTDNWWSCCGCRFGISSQFDSFVGQLGGVRVDVFCCYIWLSRALPTFAFLFWKVITYSKHVSKHVWQKSRSKCLW